MCKPNSLMKTVTVRDAHTNPILSYCVHAYTKGICFNIIYSTVWVKHISLSGNLEVLSPMGHINIRWGHIRYNL